MITAIWQRLSPVLQFALAPGQRQSEIQHIRRVDLEGYVCTQQDAKTVDYRRYYGDLSGPWGCCLQSERYLRLADQSQA